MQDLPELAPPMEEEDEKPKIGGPKKESVAKLLVNKSKPKEGEEIRSQHETSCKAHTAGTG
jgi:hypothetical protein